MTSKWRNQNAKKKAGNSVEEGDENETNSIQQQNENESNSTPSVYLSTLSINQGEGSGEGNQPKKRKDRGTCDELADCAEKLGFPRTDGEILFDKWEGNGWTNDAKPIRDWERTMSSWSKRGFMPSQQSSNKTKPRIQSAI